MVGIMGAPRLLTMGTTMPRKTSVRTSARGGWLIMFAMSRLADSFVRYLVSINAGAAAMLLAALLVTGVWQDAATDFVPSIALALAFHGAALLAAACLPALRWLRLRARSPFAARVAGYLAAAACAACIACFAAGLGVVVWSGLTGIDSGGGDVQSRGVPL